MWLINVYKPICLANVIMAKYQYVMASNGVSMVAVIMCNGYYSIVA